MIFTTKALAIAKAFSFYKVQRKTTCKKELLSFSLKRGNRIQLCAIISKPIAMTFVIGRKETETQGVAILSTENDPLDGGLHMLGAYTLCRTFLE
jgi:hypothetical protein